MYGFGIGIAMPTGNVYAYGVYIVGVGVDMLAVVVLLALIVVGMWGEVAANDTRPCLL